MISAKKQRKTIEWEGLEISSRKLEIPRVSWYIYKDRHNKGQKCYGPKRSRKYQGEVARIHRRTVQKRSHDPDNHDGMITDLKPDFPECEVKWSLGSITTTKLV